MKAQLLEQKTTRKILKKSIYDQYKQQQKADKQKAQRKMMVYFFNTLPSSFEITKDIVFGECLLQHSDHHSRVLFNNKQADINVNNNDRILGRYIMNLFQILILEIYNTNQKSFRNRFHKYTRIRMINVIQARVSMFYCDTIIVYKEDRTQKIRCVLIQAIDIGLEKKNQFRSRLVNNLDKLNNGRTKHGILNSIKYESTTLMNYQQYIFVNNQKDELAKQAVSNNSDNNKDGSRRQEPQKTEQSSKKNKKYNESDLKEVQTINLRKIKQQIQRSQKNKENKPNVNKNYANSNKNREQSCQILADLNKLYYIYSQKIQKQSNVNKYSYIATRTDSDNKQLITLHVYMKNDLIQNPSLMSIIHRECQYFKNYQIITPYVPTLSRVILVGEAVILEYHHFEGKTLDQLICKDRLNIQKNYTKQLIAEIVMSLGHLHQCKFVYGNLTSKNIMLNFDGHVYLLGKHIIKVYNDYDSEQISTNSDIHYNKQIGTMSPQQLKNKNQISYTSDWWSLGLLIYQIVTKKSYFQGMSEQQIKRTLLSQKQLDLQAVKKFTSKQPELQNLLRKLLTKNMQKRIGTVNDYHSILNEQYFKTQNKKKLTKRQGEPILKIKQTKNDKQLKQLQIIKIVKQNNQIKDKQMKMLSQSKIKMQQLLKQCIFDCEFEGN